MQFELTWDHVLAGWPPYLKQAGIDPALADRTFARLRAFFGDDPMAVPPPMLSSFTNMVRQNLDWLVWLTDCLDRFAAADGYASLCADLRDRDKYDAAATVLQVADRLHAVDMDIGFDVRFAGSKKVPDLRFRDRATDTSFYAEVSIMFTAQPQVDASRFFRGLIDLGHSFYDDPVVCGGRILRAVAPEEADGLLGRVRWEMLEVRRDRKFREVTFDDCLLLALAPEALKEEVDRWSEARQFEPGTFGAAMPAVDDFWRLHGKITEEEQQLPAGQPNLVVIWAQSLLLISQDPRVLLPYIRGIAREHPQVALLVVVFEDAPAPIAHAAAGDCLIAAGKRGGVNFQHIIVPNDACPTPFSPEMLLKLKSAFTL